MCAMSRRPLGRKYPFRPRTRTRTRTRALVCCLAAGWMAMVGIYGETWYTKIWWCFRGRGGEAQG